MMRCLRFINILPSREENNPSPKTGKIKQEGISYTWNGDFLISITLFNKTAKPGFFYFVLIKKYIFNDAKWFIDQLIEIFFYVFFIHLPIWFQIWKFCNFIYSHFICFILISISYLAEQREFKNHSLDIIILGFLKSKIK